MLTFALCEDEAYFASKLTRQVRAYLDRRGLEACLQVYPDGLSLLRENLPADVLLLDIKLPGLDGLELAARLRASGFGGPLLFLTAYPEYVFRSFDLDAVHYLLKPIQDAQLAAALDKALARLPSGQEPVLWLSSRGRRIRLPHRDILFCEALDHQVTVHTLTKSYPYSGTLDALEAALPDTFFRCHKSYLVNLHRVTALAPGTAAVTGGQTVLVARRRQKALTQRLLSALPEGGLT